MPFFGEALVQTDVPPGPFTADKDSNPPANDMKISMEFQIPEEAATYKAALQRMLCKETLDRLIIDLLKLERQLPENGEPRKALAAVLQHLQVRMEGVGLNW